MCQALNYCYLSAFTFHNDIYLTALLASKVDVKAGISINKEIVNIITLLITKYCGILLLHLVMSNYPDNGVKNYVLIDVNW